MSGKAAKKRDSWCCRMCVSESRESSGEDCLLTSESFLELVKKVELLLPLKDAIVSLTAKVDELLGLKVTVDALQKTVEAVEGSVSFLSKKYDEVLTTAAAGQATMKSLESKVQILETTVSQQAEELQFLHSTLNDNEQYSRLCNLEIQGLPMCPGEDLTAVICDLAGKLGIQHNEADVEAIHRLPAKRDVIPVVIVRFASLAIKEKWMSCRKLTRALAEQKVIPLIFLNDNLTSRNKRLFWEARQRGKEKNYKYVWVRHGKIFAKKSETASPLHIYSSSDLDRLI